MPAYDTERDGRAGVDAKIVARDSLTFDFTLNPDFSQVESDEPQVTVNQRFEVFFPEKRPFFLENSGYFQTPVTLFFSRRVRDPQAGARMTGKIGGWAVGALALDDRAAGSTLDAADPRHDDRAVNGVARARREFGDSSVGGLVTSRSFAGSFNRVASADTRLRITPQWFFQGQAAVSSTESLEGEALRDATYSANLTRDSRQFSYQLDYTDIGREFRTALGFVPRTDIRQATQFLTYRWRPKTGKLLSYGPNSFVQGTWDHSGVLQDWTVRFPFDISFKGQTELFVRRTEGMERFAGIEFREHENLYSFSTSYLRWMDVSLFVTTGARPNFFPGKWGCPISRRLARRAAVADVPAGKWSAARRDLYLQQPADASGVGRAANHLRQSHRALSRELPVHARAVSARDSGLQRRLVRPVAGFVGPNEAPRRGCAADLPHSSGDCALRRVYGWLRQCRVRPGRDHPDPEPHHLHRPPVLRQNQLPLSILGVRSLFSHRPRSRLQICDRREITDLRSRPSCVGR